MKKAIRLEKFKMEGLVTYFRGEGVGYVSLAPEMRIVGDKGRSVTEFSIGTGVEPYQKFIRCVAWEKAAESVNSIGLRTGQAVKVIGRPDNKVATTRDGKTPYIGKDGKARIEERLVIRKLWLLKSMDEAVEINLYPETEPEGEAGNGDGEKDVSEVAKTTTKIKAGRH